MSRIKKAALGSLRALAFIRPPDDNFPDWHRFLDQCNAAGVTSIYADEHGKFVSFGTPMGMPLLRRWRWLQDAERRGLSFEEAEAAFELEIERDKDALLTAEAERQHSANRASLERERHHQRDVENAEKSMATAVDRLRPGWRGK